MKYSASLFFLGLVFLVAAVITAANPLRCYGVKADRVLGVIYIIFASIAALLIPAAVYCLENNM